MILPLILILVRSQAASTRRVVAAWRRRQQARASCAALRALDSRTLSDLGLHREEIPSIAAELAGVVEATRRRALRTGDGAAF